MTITRERKSAIGRHNANPNETNLTSHPRGPVASSSFAWQQPLSRCLAQASRHNPTFLSSLSSPRCFDTATRHGIIFQLNEATERWARIQDAKQTPRAPRDGIFAEKLFSPFQSV